MSFFKQILVLALVTASAVTGLGAENLLQTKSWRTVKSSGATGQTINRPDGTIELHKTSGQGVMLFYMPRREPQIVPGKSYAVEVEFMTTTPGTAGYLMLSMPGAKRSPYPVSQPQAHLKKFQKATLYFTAQPDEKEVRIHFCQRTPGKTVLRAIHLREQAMPTNLLQSPAIKWVLRKNEHSAGQMTKSGATLQITKQGLPGYLAVIPEKNLPIFPGKPYLVSMTVKKLDAQITGGMMLSMPGGKRTPYPFVKMLNPEGQSETLKFYFTAHPDEKLLRPHLIVRGEGKIILQEVQCRQLSDADYHALQEAQKVKLHSFRGRTLKKYWTPRHAERVISGAFPEAFGRQCGFVCRNLVWQAADIAAIEAKFRVSGTGGYLRLDFKSYFNGKKYASFVNSSSCPDGQWHNAVFPVALDPAWKGQITEIALTWMPGSSQVALQRVEARKKINYIPFAADLPPHRAIKLDLLKPRGQYELSWQGGTNPGLKLEFVDRHRQIIADKTLPAEQQRVALTVPEMAVTANLTVAKKFSGYPLLQFKKLPALDKPAAFWRGQWIWSQNGMGPANTQLWFQKKIHLNAAPQEAAMVISGDDVFEVFINNRSFGIGRDWATPRRFEVKSALRAGENTITVRVLNIQAWGGLLCELYAKVNGQAFYFPSDSSWQYAVGTPDKPAQINDPVVVLGAPPVAPWGSRVGYAYVGPVGKIAVTQSGVENFTAKVQEVPAVHTDKLYFKIVSGDGTNKRIQGQISPGTEKWKKGQVINVRYQLPEEFTPGGQVFLAEDFVQEVNHAPVGQPRLEQRKTAKLAKAALVGVGTRPWFVIDGQKYSPFYYLLPGTFSTDPASRAFLVRNAVTSGSQVLRFNLSMDQFWTAEHTFDFAALDRCMEVIALNAPHAKIMLSVKCGMPQWWMKKHPDDCTCYYGNRPIHPQKDRQALASKQYLKDAARGLRALIGHIKRAPYANAVFAMSISEGWNSEWFWSYADGRNRSARSGFSKADFATFRSYLCEKYHTNQNLAKAWHRPGLTFDTITMPTPREQDRGTVVTLLDPQRDMAKIDWFEFRNRAIAEAITELCKVVKQETHGQWLTGAYYGYLIAFCNIYQRLQTVGHLGLEKLTRSPYVNFVTGPSFYHWRYMGMADSPMQAAEVFTAHNKLVIVEQDIRTFSENSEYESYNGKVNTVEQSVSALNRAFGLAIARGIGTHWLEMYENWFREKVLLDLLNEQQKVYRALPEVQGTTPIEICIVSDAKSAFYTKHHQGDGVHLGLIGLLAQHMNEVPAPFRHVLKADLLQDGLIPPHKFYIITNLLMLTNSERQALLARFAREKATVLWLYGPGIFTPTAGPSAELCGNLLGLKITMEQTKQAPRLIYQHQGEKLTVANPNVTGPWFYPESGYQHVLGQSPHGRPMLVGWQKNGVPHYFCTLTYLPPVILHALAAQAGVHMYAAQTGDALHIGNDVIFLHTKTSGQKRIWLRPGMQMKAIIGPKTGILQSGQAWTAPSGETYGFVVTPQN